MHYKNGREAKAGDIVVCLDKWNRKVGIVYDTSPGATTCNARLAPISNTDPSVTLSDCLHIEDCEPKASVENPAP